MATPQLSPGTLVREVDLTLGRVDNVIGNVGAIAGPFPIGPVNYPIDITNEQELINVFGKPISTDGQYEYWMSAASFLSYGGVLKVVRSGSGFLNNANAAVGAASTAIDIDNYDDYINNHSDASDFTFAAKNPGSWANDLKVCLIDDKADQILSGVATDGVSLGMGVTTGISSITAGVGQLTSFNGYLKGIVTGIGASTIDVKVVSRVSNTGTETKIDYQEGSVVSSFRNGQTISFVNSAGVSTTSTTITSVSDWYDQQTLGLTNAVIFWKEIAPKPVTNKSSLDAQGENDALHIVVSDDTGKVTGIRGNIVEKHIGISKALDATSSVNSPQKIWYENYLADFSAHIYAGSNPSASVDAYWGTSPVATGFSTYSGVAAESFTPISTSDGLWGQNAQGITFSCIGNVTYILSGGTDYDGGTRMNPSLSDVVSGYSLFSNKDEIQVDYLIMGPGFSSQEESQAKANYLISIAESRKDCMACIGPHRGTLVGITDTQTQTDNMINFFSSLNSSSYAVFDSGYKYTYDRFNNTFRYVPCNGDIAGLMTRTNIVSYPWFSPAGQQRGIINDAIKLAYNPNKAQRDKLYPARINSIVTQPGVGTLLFGDKTALSYPSAFDRINVRRLFLTIEKALQRAAEAQLFELNDELTRANFRNIVEPYLRDVQAKRGLYGFSVVCDTTNNTPDVIDNNEFRADIFLKPTKSINYITLTFVATRTGVSFEEVTGRV